jgi:YidC/Oxa1 family membrane protein insertase
LDLRRLAAVLLIFAAALAMFVVYVQRQAKQRQAGQTPATAPAAASPAASSAPARPAAPTTQPVIPEAASAPTPSVKWFGTRATPGEFAIGSLEPNGYLLQLQLTSRGAGIYTAKLADYFTTVADKRLHAKDPRGYESAQAARPDKYKGHYSVLNPMPGGGRPVLPLATRGLSIEVQGQPDAAIVLDDLDSKHWALEDLSADRIRLSYVLYRGIDWDQARQAPVLKLTKSYQLAKGDFSVTVSLKVENLSDLPLRVSLDQLGPTGVPREDPRADNRRAVYGKLNLDDQKVRITAKPANELGKMEPWREITLGSSDQPSPLLWVGHLDKFFGAIMYLLPETAGQLHSPTWKAQFYVLAAPEGPHPQSRAFVTGMKIPDLQLPPGGGARELRWELFVGPKKRDLFSDATAPHSKELYRQLNYLGTIDFSGGCCSWAPLTMGMMWLLEAFSKVTLGNYGVAIILLVFLVRIALHPLTKRSQVSMMKMQKFAPQMQKLREKHGDDKAALNREMMQLYKQQGATPLLGCLPMVLQMPIWVALFTALNVAVELRHAAFLPVWITDLAGPDALFIWPPAYSIPFFGNSFNLLPILLTVAMFFQTKMTPQMTPTAAASPDAARQQKMMQYMMPVMMLLLFYNTPSGLTLYIMASTFAGVAEQVVIRRHIRAREAAAAAVETTIEMPGKAARASRPKKPKGPFWVKRG